MRFSIKQLQTLRGAISSAIMNEQEFVNCYYDQFGKCRDKPLVNTTRRFIRRMARLDSLLAEEIRNRKGIL